MKPSTASILSLLRSLSPDQARRWAGCDRLAARVNELRAEGYHIATVREPHPGGAHARYVLIETTQLTLDGRA